MTPVSGFRQINDVKVGEKVYAIGNPSGLEATFTEGMVSGLRSHKAVNYIQTTAPISSGSSGGALIDSYGNLIGITTFILKDAQNLNFAISIDNFVDRKEALANALNVNIAHANTSKIYSSRIKFIVNHGATSKNEFDLLFADYVPIKKEAVSPSKALQLNKLGHEALSKGNVNEAADHFGKAVEANPNNAEYTGNYGYTLYLLGNYVQAEKMLVESLEASPKRASAWFTLGEVYSFLGNRELALKCLRYACFTTRNIDTTKRILLEKSRTSESEILRSLCEMIYKELS